MKIRPHVFVHFVVLWLSTASYGFIYPEIRWRMREISLNSQARENLSFQDAKEQIIRQSLVKEAMNQESLVDANFMGVGNLPGKTQNITCLVIGNEQAGTTSDEIPCLFVPVVDDRVLKPLECALRNEKLTKLQLLNLNSILLNRDGALFDNLPWSTWSVDPDKINRDAAGNTINSKYHMGKREAYQKLLGKDWKRVFEDTPELETRILEMEIREAQMTLAEFDYLIAVARQNEPDGIEALESEREIASNKIQELEAERSKSARGQTNTFPLFDRSGSPAAYESPFHHFRDLIEEQLNAEIIGTVIEQSNLIPGSVTAGGALVLRRKMAKRSISVGSDTLSVEDTTETYGNEGITGDTTLVVDCEVDEVVGFSISCNLPLQIEEKLWKKGAIMSRKVDSSSSHFGTFRASDTSLTLLVEGQSKDEAPSERVSPIRLPLSTVSLFDSVTGPGLKSQQRDMFPTDNPVKSLSQYDNMSNEDKAALLLGMSNFEGRLPRPRALLSSTRNPLDELLLPLIDEAVRRLFLIREAKQNGDVELAQRLEEGKSRRQKAIEAAEANDEEEARYLEEAAFYESLRADVTQDEGSYSRFLDRDDWYEMERQKMSKRVDKSKFGTLLDGIE